jgi:hypothetical protein
MFDAPIRIRLSVSALVAAALLTSRADAADPVCVGTKLAKTAGAVTKAFKVCTTGMTSPCAIPVYQKLGAQLDAITEKSLCTNARSTEHVTGTIGGIDVNVRSLFGPGDCAEAQYAATGRKAKSDLKAYGRDAKKPDAAALTAALAKNHDRFAEKFADAVAIGGCNTTDAAYVESKTDERLTQPIVEAFNAACGNAAIETSEECDGASLGYCEACRSDCGCSVCGNGVKDPGEACDFADDAACPGACEDDCGCPGPVVCGDEDIDDPELCDGVHAGFCSNFTSLQCNGTCQCCSFSDCTAIWTCCGGLNCTNIQPASPPFGYVGDCTP